MLLAIDPGKSTGWAEFNEEKRLVVCGATDEIGILNGLWKPQHVVIEYPQVYPTTPAKQANDLIGLAIQAGEYKHHFIWRGANVRLVRPAEWKGQVPKPIHNARVRTWLSPAEKDIVAKAGEGLNVKALTDMVDAVGLGCWALKRDMPWTGQAVFMSPEQRAKFT